MQNQSHSHLVNMSANKPQAQGVSGRSGRGLGTRAGKGLVKKDTNLQTITLLPRGQDGVTAGGFQANPHMRSLDYTELGQRESTDLSVQEPVHILNQRGASGARQGKASNTGGKHAGRDGDTIVYSPTDPRQLTEDAALPHSIDEVVKLPAPAQAFGKKQSGAQAQLSALS